MFVLKNNVRQLNKFTDLVHLRPLKLIEHPLNTVTV